MLHEGPEMQTEAALNPSSKKIEINLLGEEGLTIIS